MRIAVRTVPRDTPCSCCRWLSLGRSERGSSWPDVIAVEGLCQEAVRRGRHRLTVSYHLRENGPEGFYERLGFRPTGEHIHSEVLAERILTTDAKASQATSRG
jgi:hypothetical protein